MPVEGLMFVAGQPVAGSGESFTGTDAASGAALGPAFRTAGAEEVEAALAAAAAAAPAEPAPAEAAPAAEAPAETATPQEDTPA